MDVSRLEKMLVSFIELKENLVKLFFRISTFFPQFFLHITSLTVFSNDVAVVNGLIGIYIPQKMFMIDGLNALQLCLEEIPGHLILQ